MWYSGSQVKKVYEGESNQIKSSKMNIEELKTTKKVKRHSIREWEKIFANHISVRFVFRIYKELLQFNNKKTA